jgi:hypothetical protein
MEVQNAGGDCQEWTGGSVLKHVLDHSNEANNSEGFKRHYDPAMTPSLLLSFVIM